MNLPKGWKDVQISKISIIQTGIAKNSKLSRIGQKRPFLRVANIQDGYLDLKEVHEIPLPDNKVDQYSVRKDDILMVEGNGNPENLGRCAIWDGKIPNCVHQNHLFVVRTNKRLSDFRFVANQIQSKRGRDYLLSCSKSSSGLATLNSTQLSEFPILLPPLPEQKAIADLLSTWDAAIEKTEHLIAAKEKQFQWLLNELITKPSKSGMWKDVKFGDLYDKEIIIEKGRPLTREEIGDSGTIPVVAGGQSYSCYNNSATHTVETITISSSGAYAGFVWYHSYPIWASDCSVITSNTINMRFLYHVLKSKQLSIYALQAGGAQPHIYSKDLANIRVAIPRRNDQDQTVFVLDSANKEIDVMKNVADKYKQQKRGLMQKLLTGTWQITPEIIKNYEDATL